jgi:hypothetical protein
MQTFGTAIMGDNLVPGVGASVVGWAGKAERALCLRFEDAWLPATPAAVAAANRGLARAEGAPQLWPPGDNIFMVLSEAALRRMLAFVQGGAGKAAEHCRRRRS